MSIIIVYGDQGCGKTRNTAKLKKKYNCARVVDDWDGIRELKDGDLALTTIFPPFNVRGAKSVHFNAAIQEGSQA